MILSVKLTVISIRYRDLNLVYICNVSTFLNTTKSLSQCKPYNKRKQNEKNYKYKCDPNTHI